MKKRFLALPMVLIILVVLTAIVSAGDTNELIYDGSFRDGTGGSGCEGPWEEGDDADVRTYCYAAVLEDYTSGEGWVAYDSDDWEPNFRSNTELTAELQQSPGVYAEYYLTAYCNDEWVYCTVSHTGNTITEKSCCINHNSYPNECTDIGVSLKYIDSPGSNNGVVHNLEVVYLGLPGPGDCE